MVRELNTTTTAEANVELKIWQVERWPWGSFFLIFYMAMGIMASKRLVALYGWSSSSFKQHWHSWWPWLNILPKCWLILDSMIMAIYVISMPTHTILNYCFLNMISSKKEKAWFFLWCHFFLQWKRCQISITSGRFVESQIPRLIWSGWEKGFNAFQRLLVHFFQFRWFPYRFDSYFLWSRNESESGWARRMSHCASTKNIQTVRSSPPKPALRERQVHPQQNWQFFGWV